MLFISLTFLISKRGYLMKSTNTNQQFINPPDIPSCKGPEGVFYDFNDGARVLLPEGKWHVRLLDADSGNLLFSCDADNGWVVSNKKYFVRFQIQIFHRGDEKPFIDETLDLKNKSVVISFPVGTLGDLIGWFCYAERFQLQHKCHLECVMGEEIIELLAGQYPDITFSSYSTQRTQAPYATYRIGLFFGGNTEYQPIDFRQVGFHRSAGWILGTDPREAPPRLDLSAERIINEPYVCIAVQSTCQAKYWNNGTGWSEVVTHLKALGYRVLCIDLHAHYGEGYVWNHIPWGAEDYTGRVPLQERVNLLRHASFFVGLASGLSWLAWACRIPVVLISGFSLPNSEFFTPWRVFNSHGCYGCWDDTSLEFDHYDFFWCPRHKGTPRQFECSRLITGKQVIQMITKLRQSLQIEGENTK